MSTLDRADGETCKIEIALGIEPRHLRGLAADQRTAAFLARVRDAFDHDRGRIDVEFPGRVIVEEEERFRALHHDVIHAHRDKILADAMKQPRFDGDLELGADAVGRSNDNGILEACGLQIEQAAEAAEICVRTGTSRCFRGRPDPGHKFLARINIDAGVFIGEAVLAGVVRRCHGATEEGSPSV
ncbi:MAG: hypothetical protein WDM89_15780 [Rhizomicrobium sp.]